LSVCQLNRNENYLEGRTGIKNNDEMSDEEAEIERQAFVKEHFIEDMKLLYPGLNNEEYERAYLEYAKKVKKPEEELPTDQPSIIEYPTKKQKLTPSPEDPLDRVDEWAHKLSTEQGEEKQYFWTSEGKELLDLLESNKGLLILLIALSGAGKTALKCALASKLWNKFPDKVLSIKWTHGINNYVTDTLTATSDFSEQYLEELWEILLEKCGSDGLHYDIGDTFSAIQKVLKFALFEKRQSLGRKCEDTSNEARVFDQILRHQADVNKLKPYMYLFEKGLGRKCAEQAKENILKARYENAHTILLDLPDYDKGNLAEQRNDISEIQDWREHELTCNDEEYSQRPNLVIFMQKELFTQHFFFRKFIQIELKPCLSKDLVQYYENKFESTFPFTKEALEHVADLSRGIFRRFKKYIGVCIRSLLRSQLKKETIVIDDVITWISEGQLVQDMELELINIFPREKILRVKAVRLLHMLRKNGGSMMQTDIAKELFNGQAKAASRFLEKLEVWEYILRDSRAGKAKGQIIVHLKR